MSPATVPAKLATETRAKVVSSYPLWYQSRMPGEKPNSNESHVIWASPSTYERNDTEQIVRFNLPSQEMNGEEAQDDCDRAQE